MTIVFKLASSLNRRDEIPNQELAKEIAAKKNKKAISELVDLLQNKNKALQSDALKTLYEIGAINPELIAGFSDHFLNLLTHKNNRLVWGSMIALDYITPVVPEKIRKALPLICQTTDSGSVITRDHYVNILLHLIQAGKKESDLFDLLNEQLKTGPDNQFPSYAEKSALVLPEKFQRALLKTLQMRVSSVESETKRKRVEKLISKMTKSYNKSV
jgi:hypothetical protein